MAPAPGTKDPPQLELSDVVVRFGATRALAGVSVAIHPGEIVGVIGHNGAGKSTLVNVASGAVRPTAGSIIVRGEPVVHGGPRALARAGVRVIHQEPAIAPTLTVADNVTLGGPDAAASARRRRTLAREALAKLDPDLDVDLPAAALALGARQLVDLARATTTPASAVLLDEPTAALGQEETERLHELLRGLSLEGTAIVYVSHRLRDVLELCTRVLVLREGSLIADLLADELDASSLAAALVGGGVGEAASRSETEESTDAVAADAPVMPDAPIGVDARPRLSWESDGSRIDARPGEIVGLFGMAGGPQFALAEGLGGVRPLDDARLDGEPFAPASPADAVRRGVFVVPGDRERDGLVYGLSAIENMALPWLRDNMRGGRIDRRGLTRAYADAATELSIRGARGDAPIEAFSGGNRQKVLLARWLYGRTPSVLVLSQPLQGVDIVARRDIVHALRLAAGRGVAIIVASSESDEIAQLCDRAWICDGPASDWRCVEREPRWETHLLTALLEHHTTRDGR